MNDFGVVDWLLREAILIGIVAGSCFMRAILRSAAWYRMDRDIKLLDGQHAILSFNEVLGLDGASFFLWMLGSVFGELRKMPEAVYQYRKYAIAIVSLAGPLANLMLMILIGLLISGMTLILPHGHGTHLQQHFHHYSRYAAILNAWLFGMTLLPLPGLDGYDVLCAFAPKYVKLLPWAPVTLIGIALLPLLAPSLSESLWQMAHSLSMANILFWMTLLGQLH